MAETIRQKLESESKVLTASYEQSLVATKAFKAEMNTMYEKLQKLAERQEAYGKHGMRIAAYNHDFGTMSKELANSKTQKNFNDKKAAFQKDLGEADKLMSDSPKLLDQWEAPIKDYKTWVQGSQTWVTTARELFRKISEDASKLNARIKEFNDQVLEKIGDFLFSDAIPPVSILTPDLEDDPSRLKSIMKALEKHESDIDESRRDLKPAEKDLKERQAKLAKVAFGAKAVKR
jgi:hypothetical protein